MNVVSNDFQPVGGVRFDGNLVYTIEYPPTGVTHTLIGRVPYNREILVSYMVNSVGQIPTFSVNVSNGGGSHSFDFPSTSTPIQQMLLFVKLTRANGIYTSTFVDNLFMF